MADVADTDDGSVETSSETEIEPEQPSLEDDGKDNDDNDTSED